MESEGREEGWMREDGSWEGEGSEWGFFRINLLLRENKLAFVVVTVPVSAVVTFLVVGCKLVKELEGFRVDWNVLDFT